MSDESKPREWFIKNSFQDDHANINGPKTKGCHVIERSAYDKLLAENEDLKVYKDQVWSYVQGTGNTSPKTLGFHVAEALVMDHKDLKKERDRALAMLKKAAQYLREGKAKFAPNTTNSFVDDWLAEYRREFGGEGNEKET